MESDRLRLDNGSELVKVLNAYRFHSTRECSRSRMRGWSTTTSTGHDALGRVPPLKYLPRVSSDVSRQT